MRLGIGTIVLLAAAVAGCHDTGGSSPAPTYTIGGTVSGLQGSLTLQDNGGNDLTVTANGSFTFTTPLNSGVAYTVTVKTQPTSPVQTCAVGAGTGTVGNANVTGVTIACVTNTYNIGGSVSGLIGSGLVLQNNNGDDLPVSSNGSFSFPTVIASGSTYNVSVKTQPSTTSEICTVGMSNGTVTNADVTTVAVTCSIVTYTLGGTITGLTGTGLVLQNNGGDDLAVAANATSFVFATKLLDTASFAITVKTQPTNPAQTCTVTNGSGTIPQANYMAAQVTCTTNVVNACNTENGTVVTHSGNITASETWAGNGTVHMVPNTIAVMAPATVTIQKCAIVKLGAGAEIDVKGDQVNLKSAQLIAAGDDPSTGVVYFKAASAQSPWGRIRGVDRTSYVELNNVSISGGGAVGGANHNAVIFMQGNSAQGSASTHPDPVLKVNNATLIGNAGAGVYLSEAAFTSDSQALTIQNSGDYALMMWMMATGTIPTGTYSGNAHDEALIVENFLVFDDLTISTPLPIHLPAGVNVNVAGSAPLFVNHVTLTLQAGVTLKLQATSSNTAYMLFGTTTGTETGTLIANGTAQAPVTFTSGADVPAPGDWGGIWLAYSAGSQLNHVIIEYAGADNSIGPLSCPPVSNPPYRHTAALLVGDDDPNGYVPPASLVANSLFKNNGGNFAIDSVWTTGSFGPDLTGSNQFQSSSAVCTQSKNRLTTTGCSQGGSDASGCLVP